MSGNEWLNRLSDAILKGDSEEALTLVDTLHRNSVDMQRLANELCAHFRDIMVCKAIKSDKKPVVASKAWLEILNKKAEAFDIKDIMRALKMLSESIAAMQTGSRRSVFEMTIIKLCNPQLSTDLESLEKRVRMLESGVVKVSPQKSESEVSAPKVEKKAQKTPIEEPPILVEEAEPTPSDSEEPIKEWQEILKTLKTTCPLIVGVLDGSRAFVSGQYLLIDAPNPQFRDLINNKNSIYRDAVRKAAEDVLGVTYKLGPYHKKQVSAEEDPLKALAEKLKQMQG
jgi:DNA polymerase-3 subunit gamma/tau